MCNYLKKTKRKEITYRSSVTDTNDFMINIHLKIYLFIIRKLISNYIFLVM